MSGLARRAGPADGHYAVHPAARRRLPRPPSRARPLPGRVRPAPSTLGTSGGDAGPSARGARRRPGRCLAMPRRRCGGRPARRRTSRRPCTAAPARRHRSGRRASSGPGHRPRGASGGSGRDRRPTRRASPATRASRVMPSRAASRRSSSSRCSSDTPTTVPLWMGTRCPAPLHPTGNGEGCVSGRTAVRRQLRANPISTMVPERSEASATLSVAARDAITDVPRPRPGLSVRGSKPRPSSMTATARCAGSP